MSLHKKIGTEDSDNHKHISLYRQSNLLTSFMFILIVILLYTIVAIQYIPMRTSYLLQPYMQLNHRKFIGFNNSQITNTPNGPGQFNEYTHDEKQTYTDIAKDMDQSLGDMESEARESVTISDLTKDNTTIEETTENVCPKPSDFGGKLENIIIKQTDMKQNQLFDHVCEASYETLVYDQAEHMYKNYKNDRLKHNEDTLTQYDQYSYKINWAIYESSHIIMTMVERFKEIKTNGGSSFRIVVHGYHKYLCNILDSFNGVYTICCPYVPPCSTIEITQMFTNFGAFIEKETLYPSVRNIANITTCDQEHETREATANDMTEFNEQMSYQVVCNREPTFMSRYGRWIQVNDTYHWGLSSDCLMEYMTTKELQECFLDNIQMLSCFGQSHLRYTITYLSSLLNGTFPKSKYENWGYDNMFFQWSPQSRATACSLREMSSYSKRFKSSNSCIVIETGPWDLKYDTLTSYWSVIRHLMIPTISLIRESKYWRNITFVWLSNIALPHSYEYFIDEYHRRSDFRSAAVNGLIYELTQDLNVHVINHLMTTSPRSNTDNVCGHHFICHKDFNKPNETIGEVGKAIAHLLFHQICRKW
ncbi:unnamed protein product [Owenia fusiformis]|uniref:Uncharacterized protein n=1 Tax=Owenia fusiformis TaxID=6347 RepID=A0A8J1UH55_OWEFU|nr:unnamed protein product [Owenia fusiformis]